MNVLIIEDDPTLSRNVSEALIAEGYNVERVYDGLLAERLLNNNKFDCVILDINLPGKDGFKLCKEFKVKNTVTPVLMLTAFADIADKIKGFDCGADDYLTKPFYMRELILRVKSLMKLRKYSGASVEKSHIFYADDIALNDDQKKVFRQGKEVNLTPREYQILRRLMERKGEIVSKAELIKEIWGGFLDANTNTVEVYINFLRNKLDKPFSKSTIKTKVGYGYYLDIS